jgi:hypothetical protein
MVYYQPDNGPPVFKFGNANQTHPAVFTGRPSVRKILENGTAG